MARKNKDGQFIISAAEVGTYAVCPESWRLKTLEGLSDEENLDAINKGNKLHNSWAKQNAEALYFKRGINILLLLIAHAIVLGFYIHNFK